MALNLNVIPVNWQVPGAYVGVDGSGAVQGIAPQRKPVLLLGTRLSSGTIAQQVIKPITSASQGQTYFGRGSQLASMISSFIAANPYAELYAMALNEDAAGVKATATVTFTGPATADGTLSFIWGGRRRKVGVTKGMTATQIAAAVVAADTADLDSQTTSANVAGVVTATARHKGSYGNDLSIFLNYDNGDETPAGVGVTITDFASGATDPDAADAVSALGGDDLYYTIVSGWNADANMDVLEAELELRWGPIKALPGHLFAAFRGDHTDSVTYGDARNSPFSSVLATGLSPTPPWMWASALAAIEVAESDPAIPRQNTKIPGCYPPVSADRFDINERNLLLLDGMATYKVVSDEPYIERLITTYQENANGQEDASYKDIETMRCLAYFRQAFVSRIKLKYPKAKLGNDGENFAPGQVVMTPKLMRGECLALFDLLNQAAIVEGRKQFETELICERDADDPNRMNVKLPPDFVNQFRQTAALVSFKL